MKKKEEEPPAAFGRVGNTLKMGIVGFPNVGKSSTFNLLSHMQVKAENAPFSTIEPNVARVVVADPRLDRLCALFSPKSRVPATLTVYDIAGLVPNAHKGEGLGSQFLSNIQAVDGIYHLVRLFDDPTIVHTEVELDPLRDLAAISHELCMKDLMAVERRLAELAGKIAKSNDAPSKRERDLLLRLCEPLAADRWVASLPWTAAEIEQLNDYLFFTAKPVVYLLNLSAADFLARRNPLLARVKAWVDTHCPGRIVPFSVEFEQAKERGEAEGASATDRIVHAGYEALGLAHYFTAGEDEVRAWTVRRHTKAPRAAGVIHSDFELGFICAEVMRFADLDELGSELEVRNAGKYRQQGREYRVEDGDVIFFRSNPPKARKK